MPDTISKDYDPTLTPKEVGARTSGHLGIKKANTKAWQLLILGFLPAFISVSALNPFLVAMEQGMGKVVAGHAFGVGVSACGCGWGRAVYRQHHDDCGGAITMLYSPLQLLKNWVVVYVGNFAGAVLTAYLVYKSGIFGHGATQPAWVIWR